MRAHAPPASYTYTTAPAGTLPRRVEPVEALSYTSAPLTHTARKSGFSGGSPSYMPLPVLSVRESCVSLVPG